MERLPVRSRGWVIQNVGSRDNPGRVKREKHKKEGNTYIGCKIIIRDRKKETEKSITVRTKRYMSFSWNSGS